MASTTAVRRVSAYSPAWRVTAPAPSRVTVKVAAPRLAAMAAWSTSQGRGPLVVRSSSTLITLLYAIAVGTPAVVLANRLTVLGAVVLTVLLAVVLLPVRARLERAVRSSVFGDRDRHLALLSELGARLEHEVELDRVLSHLAEALRTGLDASWVKLKAEVVAERTALRAKAGTLTARLHK